MPSSRDAAWPHEQELADLRGRIEEQQRNYEMGNISGERHFSSLARMEAAESKLKRDKQQYEQRQQARTRVVADLAEEWDKDDFTLEQRQAAIGETLTGDCHQPVGEGAAVHP